MTRINSGLDGLNAFQDMAFTDPKLFLSSSFYRPDLSVFEARNPRSVYLKVRESLPLTLINVL